MGILFYLPLLTFFSLKLSYYLFLAVVRALWLLSQFLRGNWRVLDHRQWLVSPFLPVNWRPLDWCRSAASRRITGSSCATSNSSSSNEALSSGSMPTLTAGQAAASPRHSLVQFLNNILSARGPSSLPYEESVKVHIRQHLLAMIKENQGLQIKTATFTHNDGRTSYLLQGTGTIPMFYKDVKYNIPITIWLVDAYPRVAPLVFVTPTRDMIIKPQHRYVDASGTVSVPYLQQWIFPRSNLVDLIQSLSAGFSEDPPLYSRPPSVATQREQAAAAAAAASPRPTSSSQSIHATNPMHSSGVPGRASSTSPAHQGSPSNQSPGRFSRPPYTVGSSSPGPASPRVAATAAATPEEAFRISAVNTLTERIQRDSKAVLRRGAVEMDDLFNTQVALNERKEQVSRGFQELRQEKESMEEQLQFYMTNTDVLESWLKQNGGEHRSDLNIDDVFQPVDAISRQLLDSTATDLSIEDELYSLDRAVQDGSVPWEAYHKAVRQLAREQFYHRATCLKVTDVVRHMQVESMAARASENDFETHREAQ